MNPLTRLGSVNIWRRVRASRVVSWLKQWSVKGGTYSSAPQRQFQHSISATLENRPQGIYFGVDHPTDAREIHTSILVEGWACAEAGIEAIALYLDGVLLQEIQPSLARPDVAAALPHLTAAATSGFSTHLEDIGAVSEFLVLTLAFRDRQGRCAVTERTVRVQPFRDPLSATLETRPKGIHWGINRLVVPHYDSSGTVPVVGWACADAKIEKIALYLDGALVQELQPNLARPDVAASFPAVPDAATSGFFTTISLTDAQEGESSLIFAFYDQVDRCAVAEFPLHLAKNNLHYHQYFLATLPSHAEADAMLTELHNQTLPLPHFEWWIWGESEVAISTSLSSIIEQNYPEWHCYLVAPLEQWPVLETTLREIVAPNQRSRVTLQATLTPSAAVASSATYLGFIRAGEILAPHALVRWATALATVQPDLSYTDNDQLKRGNMRCEAHFKPDWSPDYALARNYVGGVYAARKIPSVLDALSKIADLDVAGAWRYDLWLCLTETTVSIHHVREALWSKPYEGIPEPAVNQRELAAVEAALQRRQCRATVKAIADGSMRCIHWSLPDSPPLVSIIIPTTGRLALVQPLVESLLAKTAYRPYELIFIDNGRGQHPDGIRYLHQQDVKVIEYDAPFNWSRLNNIGAVAAQGEMLLFLNDDIEVIDADWLSELVAQASRPEIGVVGALLLYPDGRIQHGGIFLVNQGGGVCHSLQYLDPKNHIYQNLGQIVREVSSNTGACLMMSRAIFEGMNGFDESYEMVGSDIDLTLQVHAAGYRNLWTPAAQLIHHESISRQRSPVDVDEQKFRRQWKSLLEQGDPFYNPNLTQDCSDCSLREPPPVTAQKATTAQNPAYQTALMGINLISFIRAEMGLGEASRGLASAISASDIPFGIIEYINFNDAQMGDNTWLHRVISEPKYEINVIHMNADLLPHIVASLPPHYFLGRYCIGYWAWELPEFPDEWLPSFDCVDEVWVPSKFVQQAVASKATVPVTCIPHTVEKPDTVYLNRDFFDLPRSKFLFLMMYDTFSYQERKNPSGTIAAFRQAFTADQQDIGLVIKVNNADEEEVNSLREAIGNGSSVYIVNDTLSRYEVDSLIHSCDCYVSLHRAEGFGLGIAEAMALGRPVIVTQWSGNTDFTNPSNAACISYELRQLDQDYGPYKAEQYWAEPNIEEAAQWMQRLVDDPALARQLGAQAQRTIAEQLSPQAIGQKIIQRLRAIQAQK